ncbi:SDR family NAD(P)-dependent oxidoreductase [Glutamicibacter mishrai]|uniref:SDR family oxidoreductase n=1 Tax=Glutamicibacter mishrai TaxID=1775880 RepID=A0A6H0SFY2_9MICC|nr:SDR family oxidoreductase [Glutamicibacter mishrai]QIV86070.1 SDR family oxidoreductase [Glutamicibacter mishrai]
MDKIDYTQETTLVTGASSGLGAEFARQLAARGSNLILVARRADRLHDLESDLTGKYGISVTTVPFDLATADSGRRLHQELTQRGVKATSLINCAGFGTHGDFTQEDAERIQQEITLNVAALVDATHAFLPDLRGVLVNVASLLAYQSWPTAAVYGATKAFVLSFTEALWEEMQDNDLRILALGPGPTRTEFFDVAGSDQMSAGAPMQTSAQVVRTALRVLDRRTPPPSVVSGPINKVIATLPRLLPRRLAVQTFGKIVRRGAVAK